MTTEASSSRTWFRQAALRSVIIAGTLTGMAMAIPRAEGQQPSWKLALFTLGMAVYVLFGFWSWRRLQPIRRDDAGRRHIDLSILVFGLGLALTAPIRRAIEDAGGATWGLLWQRAFWFDLLMGWVIAVPICLWAGHFFGSSMQVFVGRRP